MNFKYFWADKIKENEISWPRGTYREEEKCIQGLGGEIMCIRLPEDRHTAGF
jgi:hypothetical protein